MDSKATSMAPPSFITPAKPSVAPPGSSGEPDSASPVQPYAGKFDPKSIAKKSAASRSQETKSVLGSLDGQPGQLARPAAATASNQAPTGEILRLKRAVRA